MLRLNYDAVAEAAEVQMLPADFLTPFLRECLCVRGLEGPGELCQTCGCHVGTMWVPCGGIGIQWHVLGMRRDRRRAAQLPRMQLLVSSGMHGQRTLGLDSVLPVPLSYNFPYHSPPKLTLIHTLTLTQL